MKTLIKLIKQFNRYRKDVKSLEAYGIGMSQDDMYRWFKLPQGKEFFDILLKMLNNSTQDVFIGYKAVKSYDEFMFAKGRMEILKNIMLYIKQLIFEKEGKQEDK